MKIIQVVDGYKSGDGVGNVIAAMDELFKKNRYETQICNRQLEYEDIDSEKFGSDTIVFYHLALLTDPILKHLRCKKVLIFHNITEPDFLEGADEEKRIWCSAGLFDTAKTADYFDKAITFSEYSKKCLMEMGWRSRDIFVLPILVRFGQFSQKPSKEIIEKYRNDSVNILFTGRVYPNKKHEDVIAAFAAYKEQYQKNAKLFLIGSIGGGNYYPSLLAYAEKLGVSEDVVFPGHVSFGEYLAYYLIADLYLCMSAHEGFCIPLVEAMYFHIPIIAHASTAVPDTLAGSGVLVHTRSPEAVARTMNLVLENSTYRQEIIDGQNIRLKQLQPKALEEQYLRILKKVINELSTANQFSISDESIANQFDTIDESIANRFGIGDSSYDSIEKAAGKYQFSLVSNILEQVEQRSVYREKYVVYGAGAAGMRLYKALKRSCPEEKLILCDSYKSGVYDPEAGCTILSPDEAVESGREGSFIISIQDKRILLEKALFLTEQGIRKGQILIYDKLNNQIL